MRERERERERREEGTKEEEKVEENKKKNHTPTRREGMNIYQSFREAWEERRDKERRRRRRRGTLEYVSHHSIDKKKLGH
jgi:hypothetical protein